MFAALTILAMVSFVLISGSISVLQTFMPNLGASKTPEVARLYGEPVYKREFDLLQRQRNIANIYMANAVSLAGNNWADYLIKAIGEAPMDELAKRPLVEVLQARQVALNPRALNLPEQYYRQFAAQYLRLARAEMLLPIRQELLSKDKKNEADLVQQVMELVGLDVRLLQRPPKELYFGGTNDARGVLDFMIWLRQADRLGIQLTPSDVNAMVRREVRKHLTQEDSRRILAGIQSQYGGVDWDLIQTGLTAEFRVRLAKEAHLGPEPSSMQQPEPLTPYSFWQFYRSQRAENDVVLLPIAVDQAEFLKKAGEPTEEELKKLFDANKDRESAPSSPLAGFKQPARYQVEWLQAKPEMPAFRNLAAVVTALGQAMPQAYRLALQEEYEGSYKYRFPSPSWTSTSFQFLLHDSSVKRPETLAATVAQILANMATGGSFGSALSVPEAVAAEQEVRARAQFGTGMSLLRARGNAWAAAALAYQGTPAQDYLPLEDVQPLLVEKMQEDWARRLASDAVRKLQDEVNAFHQPAETRKTRTRAAATAGQAAAVVGTAGSLFSIAATSVGTQARDTVEPTRFAAAAVSGGTAPAALGIAGLAVQDQLMGMEAAKKRLAEATKPWPQGYGFQHGSTVKPRDQHDLDEDPGLAPLKEGYEAANAFSRMQGQEKPFADELIQRINYLPLYDPQYLYGTDELVFKTAEFPAYVPTFAEARAKVLHRWQFEKARQFARAEAERVAGLVLKAKGDPTPTLLDASPKLGGKLIFLDHVAPLARRAPAVPSETFMSSFYEPYKLPAGTIKYPALDTVRRLIELRDKGEVAILHDHPEATYYVAALKERFPAQPVAFLNDAARINAPMIYTVSPGMMPGMFQQGPQAETLLSWLEQEERTREKYRLACLEQLRTEARLQVNEENLKTPATRDAPQNQIPFDEE
jgi:hypothetical protein